MNMSVDIYYIYQKSTGWSLLKIVWQRRCSILFSTLKFMPVVPAMLTRNKRHSVDSETVCIWLVDRSFDRAIKALCCL